MARNVRLIIMFICCAVVIGATSSFDALARGRAASSELYAQQKSKGKSKGKSGKSKGKSGSKNSKSKNTNNGSKSKAKNSAAGSQSPKNSSDAQKQASQIEKDIKKTDEEIKHGEKDIIAAEQRLKLIEGEIRDCNMRIAQLQSQLETITARETEINDSIVVMQSELEGLQGAFAKMLKSSRKSRMSMSNTSFLFSSESINQAMRRLRTLRQFNRHRQGKAEEIRQLQTTMNDRLAELADLSEQSTLALANIEAERNNIAQRKDESDKLIAYLRQHNKELRKVLNKQQQELDELNNMVRKLMAEEAARAAEEQRKAEEKRRAEAGSKASDKGSGNSSSGSTTQPPNVLTPNDGDNIINYKGRLPWPVEYKEVQYEYGRNEMKSAGNKVKVSGNINSKSMTFLTAPNQPVKAIFEGRVVSVVHIKQSSYYMVIILHQGGYISVYSNLGKVNVSANNTVKQGQVIGNVLTPANEHPRFIFMIQDVRNSNRPKDENPRDWLIKR